MKNQNMKNENVKTPCKKSKIDKISLNISALLIIDMQNDFVDSDGVLCVKGAKKTIPQIKKMLDFARKSNIFVIHVIREHNKSGLDVELPRKHLFENGKKGFCVKGTWGAKIVDDLKPKNNELIFVKKRNSAFFNTNLCDILHRLKITNLFICGTQYPNCIRGTAVDAMSHDFFVTICTDACSAQNEQIANANILDMQNMGIECKTVDEIICEKQSIK